MLVLATSCSNRVMMEGVRPMAKKVRQIFQYDDVEVDKFPAPEELYQFCDTWLLLDSDCFNKYTQSGNLTSLWSLWDKNKDGFVSTTEFTQATKTMDLDSSGETTSLELDAYFSLNSHLICRPYRNLIF